MGISNSDISHFINRSVDHHYYGLGEKTGNLNRHGRRFEMRNIDAMGYNAEYTDPLYKTYSILYYSYFRCQLWALL